VGYNKRVRRNFSHRGKKKTGFLRETGVLRMKTGEIYYETLVNMQVYFIPLLYLMLLKYLHYLRYICI
jgi:hypothetical protein